MRRFNRSIWLLVGGLCLVLLLVVMEFVNLAPSPDATQQVVASSKQTTNPSSAQSSTTPQPALPSPSTSSSVAASTQPSSNSPSTQPTKWPSELFFARPQGAQGQLVAYDMANGLERFALPVGMMSADGQWYVAAQPAPYTDEARTILTVFDLKQGRAERKFPFAGRWQVSGVSYSGRWVALTRSPSDDEKAQWTQANTWQTDVQIVDANDGKVAHTIHLDGNFEVETISPDSRALFLIQHLPAVNPDHYVIRLYDLYVEKLQADPVRGKTSDEVMAGWAWDGVASPDGHWLLTLYLNTTRNVAFVHALDLWHKFPVCIDLPSGSGNGSTTLTTGFEQLKYYSLVLSPDGSKLYAANAALGVVATINLGEYQVVRTAQFNPALYGAPLTTNLASPVARSVIAKDGQQMYFSRGWDVWAYDTTQNKVNGPYLVNTPISGLGLSGDGKRLYVASEGKPLMVFDAASGEELKFPTARVESRKQIE